jgi:hypothetical protein
MSQLNQKYDLYAENEALSSVLALLKTLKINYSDKQSDYTAKEGNKVAYDNAQQLS